MQYNEAAVSAYKSAGFKIFKETEGAVWMRIAP